MPKLTLLNRLFFLCAAIIEVDCGLFNNLLKLYIYISSVRMIAKKCTTRYFNTEYLFCYNLLPNGAVEYKWHWQKLMEKCCCCAQRIEMRKNQTGTLFLKGSFYVIKLGFKYIWFWKCWYSNWIPTIQLSKNTLNKQFIFIWLWYFNKNITNNL